MSKSRCLNFLHLAPDSRRKRNDCCCKHHVGSEVLHFRLCVYTHAALLRDFDERNGRRVGGDTCTVMRLRTKRKIKKYKPSNWPAVGIGALKQDAMCKCHVNISWGVTNIPIECCQQTRVRFHPSPATEPINLLSLITVKGVTYRRMGDPKTANPLESLTPAWVIFWSFIDRTVPSPWLTSQNPGITCI